GAVFFAQVASTHGDWSKAFELGLSTAALLVLVALVVGLADQFAERRVGTSR
ncbi:MFS transporter, partial [Streptomyces sp. SID10244]|nr:MFS transporter [Streptomyces sp. SID10244]